MSLKVLIVEDNFVIQMFLEINISEMGHSIIGTASNSVEALVLIEKNDLDLILMDIGLSGEKNGVEIAKIVNEKYQVPIIFMTGNSDAATQESARAANPVDIIYKPIDDHSLQVVIEKVSKKLNG